MGTSRIVSPASNVSITTAGSVSCLAAAVADKDTRTDYMAPQPTEVDDVVKYQWSCSSGSFNTQHGQSVTWRPSGTGTFTLTLTVDDEAKLNAGDKGTRDDAKQTFSVQVTVAGRPRCGRRTRRSPPGWRRPRPERGWRRERA